VTFDDGFCSVAQLAQPVLARHGVKAIQFLIAGKPGGQNDWDVAKGDVSESLMSEAEIRAWLAAGHAVGSHSLTHPNLKKLSTAAAREELNRSKQTLEQKFGISVRHFCYPFGGFNVETPVLAKEAGYATACTMDHGVNPPTADVFRLRRVTPLSTGELLRKVAHRLWR
jgi:peptidoglycan/xylan/chitin deacetylase (PgdA/CDA1 family)